MNPVEEATPSPEPAGNPLSPVALKQRLVANMTAPTPAATPPGQVQAGNIDLNNRPIVKNPDGSISTVRSITITDDKGRAILIPTVVGNRVVSNQEAVANYKKTGQHLGIFASEDAADKYAQMLHEAQAAQYLPKAKK